MPKEFEFGKLETVEEGNRRRALWAAQQKARIGAPLAEKPAAKAKDEAEAEKLSPEETAKRERVAEHLGKAGELAGEKGTKAKMGAAKEALAAVREAGGVTALAEMAGQQGSEFLLNILWGSLFTPFFPLILLALNLYFFASVGILDGIGGIQVSKSLAPFGLSTKILPGGLGKILGIIALFGLDFLVLVIILIILVAIYALVHPASFLWEAFSPFKD